jgi:hypothetical protein
MKKMILALLLAALCARPALANEREYYAALAAFQTTNASDGMSCQSMIRFVNSPVEARIGMGTGYYNILAFDSLNCVSDVEEETNNATLPAKAPMMLFMSSCAHIHISSLLKITENHTAERIVRACKSIGLTPAN